MEDNIRTKNHKTRLAKVELYLEVPTQYGDEVLCEDGTLNLIEKALNKEGIEFTSFGDILLSPIFDDDITSYNNPVGYLAPDGKFYVIESSEDGLAHLSLSSVVASAYDIGMKYSSLGMEHELELRGFIKVHREDVRYFSQIPYNPYSKDNLHSPDPTDEQKKSLIKYIKKFHYTLNGDKFVFVNEHRYDVKKLVKILKEGDDMCVRKVFEI